MLGYTSNVSFDSISYTALYERLSRDDEQKGESNSIANQKAFLEQFAHNKGFDNLLHFTDDGFSGVSFDRPAFNDMIRKIQEGRIHTVICKDLSRLGRNYLQVGYFTEILFPRNNVRFIAVNNSVDTDNGNENELTPFINIMNEWYAKDTSRKIKAIFNSKMKEGKRCSGSVPYGYTRKPPDKQTLVIDQPAAEVVRRIFQLYSDGYHISKIASTLRSEQILIPAAYNEKYHPENCRSHNYHDPYAWSSTTVSSILKRSEYIGHTVLKKSKGESFKSKKRCTVPPEEQLHFENTHEAIISYELFALTQKRLAESSKNQSVKKLSHRHVLSGVIFCASCGYHMTYRGPSLTKQNKNKVYDSDHAFICGNYRSCKGCSIHYVKASVIEKKILDILKIVTIDYSEKDLLSDNIIFTAFKETKEKRLTEKRSELSMIKSRIDKSISFIKALYEDKCAGVLSETLFSTLVNDYEKEICELSKKENALQKEIDELLVNKKSFSDFITLCNKYRGYHAVTEKMIEDLIDRIIIHESSGKRYHKTQQIDIYFKMIGLISI